MKINIKVAKNFQTQLNKIVAEYGNEVLDINGIGEDDLNFTHFIDNFIDSPVVADASVDSNANVHIKSMVTLLTEMPKPHRKLLSLHKIYYEMQKRWGFKDANEWLTDTLIGKLYMHDLDTASFKSYCMAYTLKDMAEKGLFFLGSGAEPAQHYITWVDFVKEFVHFNSNLTSGAVGLPDLIPYMYYYWRKDCNEDYMGIKTTHNEEKYAKQGFQRLIYALNQPYTRDGQQSAFTNTSVFDHEYMMALFGGAEFPDGTFMIDAIDEMVEFQKWYMETMSEIRSHKMFTFPVSTISLIRKDGEYADEEFASWAIEHNRKWCDSNMFIDSDVTSLSNCCFDGHQPILTKSSNGVLYTTFKDFANASYNDTKRNLTIFHNGSWVKGKLIKTPLKPMYAITTANKKTIYVSEDHICPTNHGDKIAASLTIDDYLLFNTIPLQAVPEKDLHLSYAEGVLIGMYLGDGSMAEEDVENHTPFVHLSINEEKWEKGKIYLQQVANKYNQSWTVGTIVHNMLPIRIGSHEIHDFIRTYVFGNYAHEKDLNENVLLQSYDFRKGILDGYYLTDGGNSNRIYSTSKILIDKIEMLITSLGMQSIIDQSDRRNEKVIIRGQEFNRNHILYCIRWYEPNNKRSRKNIYTKFNNNIYFKITNIEPYEIDDDNQLYCFEISNQDEPYFTLPNGIITHNCRLKSNIQDLGYFNSIGSTALKVGSVKVSTINFARLALESNDEQEFIEKLRHIAQLNMKALHCVRHIIKRNVEKGLLPNFDYGLISFSSLYNTIGFVGCYETMKKFGHVWEDELYNHYYTTGGKQLGQRIFATLDEEIAKFTEANEDVDYKINKEQAPAENAAAKLMQLDKLVYPESDIYDLPLYGNQFMPLGIQTTLQERIKTQALFDGYCNGGAILHANVDAPFATYESARKMTDYIADQGVTYFAFNTKIQVCEDNHAFYGTTCPVCGKPISAEYTRVVGFYTKVSDWSAKRREEYKLRRWANASIESEKLNED